MCGCVSTYLYVGEHACSYCLYINTISTGGEKNWREELSLSILLFFSLLKVNLSEIWFSPSSSSSLASIRLWRQTEQQENTLLWLNICQSPLPITSCVTLMDNAFLFLDRFGLQSLYYTIKASLFFTSRNWVEVKVKQTIVVVRKEKKSLINYTVKILY